MKRAGFGLPCEQLVSPTLPERVTTASNPLICHLACAKFVTPHVMHSCPEMQVIICTPHFDIEHEAPVLMKSKHFAPVLNNNLSVLGPVSRKSRKLFGPEKPFVKLSTACVGNPIF